MNAVIEDPKPEPEPDVSMSLAPSRYVKIRTVGKGAFGTAVLYRKEPEGTLVVIKQVPVLELSAAERGRALNEARVLALLAHKHVVRYLGSWERDGFLLLEMEYAGGGTLAQMITQRAQGPKPLSERRVLRIFAQVVSAIRHMHSHNVLHRDLKTENIFLTKECSVKVGDFGISKVMGTQVQAETVLGTPYYLSPEMCEGLQYDQKSDVWALGCVLYELLALRRAFSAPNLPALVRRIVATDYPAPPSRYSAGIRALLASALQRQPSSRPAANQIEDQLLPPLIAAANLSADADSLDGESGVACARSVVLELRAAGHLVSLTPVPLPARAVLRHLAVGRTHCVALTQEQVVFTWDVVDWASSGPGGGFESWRRPQHQPQCIDSLTGLGINRVGAGDGFSVFASDSGALLTSGDGAAGCLGHGDLSHCVRPRLVEKLLAADVVAVAVGWQHVAVLGGDGSLHTWGRGRDGRLGHGDGKDVCTPTAVPLPDGVVVRSLHAGPDCTAVITTTGQLLACGNNQSGKLGKPQRLFPMARTGTNWTRLRRVRGLQASVVDVSLGQGHTAVLLESGRLVLMGSGDAAKPAMSKPVLMASAGPTYTVAATHENLVYFWGTWADGVQAGVKVSGKTDAELPVEVGKKKQHKESTQDARELLALYASQQQLDRGEVLNIEELYPLPQSLLLLISTTVPLARLTRLTPAKGSAEDAECDSLGPIPDWLQEELAQSENAWGPAQKA